MQLSVKQRRGINSSKNVLKGEGAMVASGDVNSDIYVSHVFRCSIFTCDILDVDTRQGGGGPVYLKL